MAKRTQSATRNAGTAATTSSDASTAALMERRVLAFAEQLGRIAGTVQANTEKWMDGDALKNELTRVRDGAADLLRQLAGDAPAVANQKPAAGARASKGRSGGVVDAPGKKHRPRLSADPDASHVQSQAAKMRAAKTMVKTNRRRGRG